MRKRSSAYSRLPAKRCDLLRVDRHWAWHYRTLVALRNHLVAEAHAAESGITPVPDETDRFDRDFIHALLARETDPLGEINAAIDRILHGKYGVCDTTGRSISAARLCSAPWVRHGDADAQPEILTAFPGAESVGLAAVFPGK